MTTRTIYRYPLTLTYKQTLPIPTGFTVRHVAPARTWQPGDIYGVAIDVWCEVDTTKPLVLPIDFYLLGTGHSIPDHGLIYCGTAVMPDGLVWHVHLAVP